MFEPYYKLSYFLESYQDGHGSMSMMNKLNSFIAQLSLTSFFHLRNKNASSLWVNTRYTEKYHFNAVLWLVKYCDFIG